MMRFSIKIGSLRTWAEAAKVIESAAAVIALVAAAIWFHQQRETYPRADVSQTATVLPLGKGLFAVETNIAIKNEGMERIKIHRAQVMLQAVSGAAFQYENLGPLDGRAYWYASRPSSTPDRHQFQDGELRWPVLKMFAGSIDHHVEPGETDNMIFTFVVPCSRMVDADGRPVRMLRIATDIFKPQTEEGKNFAWKARDFVSASKICTAPQVR